jgi:hypothetical protein
MSEPEYRLGRRAFVTALLAGATMPRSVLGSLVRADIVSRAPRPTLGINNVPTDAESLAQLKALGISQVRYTLYWNNFLDTRSFTASEVPVAEGTPGSKKIGEWWAQTTRAYLAAGLDVLMVVHSPPGNMTLADAVKAMPPFLAARAKQFPGLTWQILNEMDLEDAWSNGWFRAKDKTLSQRRRGEMYGDLIGPVFDAVKKADPTAKVVTAGIAGEPTAFYAGLATRAPRKFDAMCVHVYGSPLALPFREKSIAMRDVLGRTPLCCTEAGFNTSDDAEQTRQLSAIISDNDANRRYDRLYLHAFTSDFAHGDHYGIVRPGGKRRSAAAMLARRIGP